MFHVIARPKKKFSLSVELQGLRWFIHLIGSLQILCSSLGQLSLSSINDLVEIMNLSESSYALSAKKELAHLIIRGFHYWFSKASHASHCIHHHFNQ